MSGVGQQLYDAIVRASEKPVRRLTVSAEKEVRQALEKTFEQLSWAVGQGLQQLETRLEQEAQLCRETEDDLGRQQLPAVIDRARSLAEKHRQQAAQYQQFANAVDAVPLPRSGSRGGVKITSPVAAACVPLGDREVRGTYKSRPHGDCRLFHIEEGGHYYPQSKVEFHPDGTWHGNVHVGGRPGGQSAILIAVVEEPLRKEIDEVYAKTGRETGVWKPFVWPDSLPPTFHPLDQVNVVRG
jgi:hypothetical protein